MKNNSPSKFLSLLTTTTLLIPLLAFTQDVLWEKSYGGNHADYLMDAQSTADYGFILAGSSFSKKTGNKNQENNGELDYLIWKMDEKGDLEWQKSFGGDGNDFLQSIKITKDGGFILAGTSNSSDEIVKGIKNDKKEPCRGGDDLWVIKLNAKGDEEWQKTIGAIGQEKLQSISQTKDGGYILGGSSSSYPTAEGDIGEKTAKNFGNMDYWIVKLDWEGKIKWQKTFGGIYMDELRSIIQTSEGGYLLGGYSNSPASGNKSEDNKGDGDYWVIKIDKDGEIDWQKSIGGNKDDQLYVVQQSYDNNYIIAGNSYSGTTFSKSKGNGSGSDFWVLKLDQEGGILWQETYNIGKVDNLTSLVENEDHSILLGGFARTEQNGKKEEKGINDYAAIKITEKGEEIWRETVGSNGEDILRKVVETRDGGYLFAGTSNPEKSSTSQLNSASKPSGISTGNGQPVKAIENSTSEVNEKVKEVNDQVNEAYKEQFVNATDKIKEGAGLNNDSPIKFGTPGNLLNSNSPLGSGTGANAMDGLMPGANQKPNVPASRDKATNFGNNDFWVVKLLDKNKPKKEKATIEAMPNPTLTYTNVIVGYEYESGTATVFDIAGHTLEQFTITSRTIPIDLSRYPMGIYIVNITTNVQSDGVKVIKGLNKN